MHDESGRRDSCAGRLELKAGKAVAFCDGIGSCEAGVRVEAESEAGIRCSGPGSCNGLVSCSGAVCGLTCNPGAEGGAAEAGAEAGVPDAGAAACASGGCCDAGVCTGREGCF